MSGAITSPRRERPKRGSGSFPCMLWRGGCIASHGGDAAGPLLPVVTGVSAEVSGICMHSPHHGHQERALAQGGPPRSKNPAKAVSAARLYDRGTMRPEDSRTFPVRY
jgi:hypothetical protein